MKRHNTYSLPEEILNSITHGVGLIMGLAVCIFFLVKGSASDTWIAPFSLVLYLIGVCSSYAASTIYHSIPASREQAKKIARKFDHAAIYWHIVKSYIFASPLKKGANCGSSSVGRASAFQCCRAGFHSTLPAGSTGTLVQKIIYDIRTVFLFRK